MKTESERKADKAAKHRKWLKENRAHINAYKRETYNPLTIKKYSLKRRYGLTWEQYCDMAHAQDYKCAICWEEPEILVVDHDHTTGKVRGLLCNGCNRAIGFVEESARVARSMADYLDRHKLLG